jgi:hypothetical protein
MGLLFWQVSSCLCMYVIVWYNFLVLDDLFDAISIRYEMGNFLGPLWFVSVVCPNPQLNRHVLKGCFHSLRRRVPNHTQSFSAYMVHEHHWGRRKIYPLMCNNWYMPIVICKAYIFNASTIGITPFLKKMNPWYHICKHDKRVDDTRTIKSSNNTPAIIGLLSIWWEVGELRYWRLISFKYLLFMIRYSHYWVIF